MGGDLGEVSSGEGKKSRLQAFFFFFWSVLDDQCLKNYFHDRVDDTALNNVTCMAESHILIP